MVALIVLFSRVLDEAGDQDVRILVASNTNVAVDRILLELQRREFLQFARVGSLKKIAKPLLKHVLHFSEKSVASGDHERLALRELEEMQRQPATTPDDRKHIQVHWLGDTRVHARGARTLDC